MIIGIHEQRLIAANQEVTVRSLGPANSSSIACTISICLAFDPPICRTVASHDAGNNMQDLCILVSREVDPLQVASCLTAASVMETFPS
jgi:hypothetical protein